MTGFKNHNTKVTPDPFKKMKMKIYHYVFITT